MSANEPSIEQRLERLSQLINEPIVQTRLPDGYYEGISEHLETVRKDGTGAIPERLLENLLGLIEGYEEMMADYANEDPVFHAANAGDWAAVERALDEGFDLESTAIDGWTLLMLAARQGLADVVAGLLDRGARIDRVNEDQNGFDAMMLACVEGHADVARLLLDHGADIHRPYTTPSSGGPIGNHSLLTISANRGRIEVCRLLIERGANIEVVSDPGYTPLMWALVNGASEDAAHLLLDAGADPEPYAQPRMAGVDPTTPLILAATNGMTSVALRLIAAGVDVNAQDGSGCTALKNAARGGHDEIVDALIAAGADLDLADDEGWTPLIAASSRAAWSTMQRLIDAGADVNITANEEHVTALQQVISRRMLRHGIVSLSRMIGREVDADTAEGYDTALVFAEKLLEAGANPDVRYDEDSDKKLIDEVAGNGDDELRELLERFGAVASEPADEDDQDDEDQEEAEISDGDRLVMAAAQLDLDRMTELLDAGVDIDHLDSDGDTALGYSVIKLCFGDPDPSDTRDLLEQIDLLLERGASVDVPGCRIAPLPTVARAGRVGLVRAFLAAGADPNVTFTDADSDAGLTAVDAATAAGHDEVVTALLEAGGRASEG